MCEGPGGGGSKMKGIWGDSGWERGGWTGERGGSAGVQNLAAEFLLPYSRQQSAPTAWLLGQ